MSTFIAVTLLLALAAVAFLRWRARRRERILRMNRSLLAYVATTPPVVVPETEITEESCHEYHTGDFPAPAEGLVRVE